MLVFRRVDFSKMIFFTIGVAVGDLGAKVTAKFWQQRFLNVIFWCGGERGPGPASQQASHQLTPQPLAKSSSQPAKHLLTPWTLTA